MKIAQKFISGKENTLQIIVPKGTIEKQRLCNIGDFIFIRLLRDLRGI
jgi:hypothetical protein